MSKRLLPVDIHPSSKLHAMTFSADGKHLLSGGQYQNVGVWRVQDGQQVTTMKAMNVHCLAVSKDGQWIAGGTSGGELFVWEAKTHAMAWTHKEREGYGDIRAVDFSPDSTRLVSASEHRTATIWDVTGKQVQIIRHSAPVVAAKFSPQGDRIATATEYSVQIWDSNNAALTRNIVTKITPCYNNGLVWFNDHIFALSGSTIRRLDPSTDSIVSWSVPISNIHSRISIPNHGEFIIYATNRTITFWDMSTHRQLGHVDHHEEINSIATSPSGLFLAIGNGDGSLTIKNLSSITASTMAHRMMACLMLHLFFKQDSFPLACRHPTLQEADIQIDQTVLSTWKNDQLEDADALLTAAIHETRHSSYHLFAARGLVRARLKNWDAALVDANLAIRIQPSIVAYVAKSVAHVGKGERDTAYRTCDIAFEHFHSSHVTLLLIIKAIIVFIAAEHPDAISRMDDLISTVPSNSTCCTACMHLLLGNMLMKSNQYESAIQSFERARARVRHYRNRLPLVVSLMSGWKFDDLHIMVRQRLCEALHAAGRPKDAREALVDMVNTFDEEIYMNAPIIEWVSGFAQQLLSAPQGAGDTISATARDTTMLMFHTPPSRLLTEWAKAQLTRGSWQNAILSTVDFVVPWLTIYRAICEYLEAIDRIIDASECFRQLVGELAVHENEAGGHSEWVHEFRNRCIETLERHGNSAANTKRHDAAISYYSASLALSPPWPQKFLIERSKAYLAQKLWVEALNDAEKVIERDPESPFGYERKHAALHEAGEYQGAINAFEAMLSKMSRSSDPEVHALRRQYVDPEETRAAIRRTVQDAIRDSPRMLIDTTSGCLCDKSEQAKSIESLPVFDKLVSSTTTHVDDVRIKHDVMEYYRYAMLSHRWQGNEPPYERVIRIAVYGLEESPTHKKLRMFCKVVQDSGLHWAWSDTCCINKSDSAVLQEALVSMFKWYHGSALTVVFLFDVDATSQFGGLMKNDWNTRAWTFQEYHASKVVRFYTKHWTLYMNLDIPNHKESPEIILEMEKATGISAQALRALRPGLNDIREKLCLASTRRATYVEDEAYSLLGIFSTPLPVVYGEGDQALGRLLAQLLTSAGDTKILAWTGKSGSFNSCLPTKITVFNQLSPPHIPLTIASSEMEITPRSRLSRSISQLYDRLHAHPVPFFVGRRLKLPCIAFKVDTKSETRSGWMVHGAFGNVEITTTEDLSQWDSLVLVHPWIDFLLNRHPIKDKSSAGSEVPSHDHSSNTMPAPPAQKSLLPANLDWPLKRSATLPAHATSKDKEALEFVARLRQPFGALLFTPTRLHVHEYKRVVADSMITVQIQEDIPWSTLLENTRILDVL